MTKFSSRHFSLIYVPRDIGLSENSFGNLKSVSGEVTDTLIRFEAFKRIFLFRPKMDFFLKSKSMVFGQKWPNFEVRIFDLFMSLAISACRNLPWILLLSLNNALTKNFRFNSHPEFIFSWLFLVPGPLGGLKSVSRDIFGHTGSIGSF